MASAGLLSTATASVTMDVTAETGEATALDGLRLSVGTGAKRLLSGQITVTATGAGPLVIAFDITFNDEAFQEFDAFGHAKERNREHVGGIF